MNGPTRFPGKEKTGIHKKKEGRFNPGGQVSMRQRRTVSVLAPRSNVHIHPVTLGESLEMMEKLNCHQGIARITIESYKMDSDNGLLKSTLPSNGQSTIDISLPEII